MSRMGFTGKVTNNEIFDLNLKRSQDFSMDQEELPQRITMDIRLNNVKKVNLIKTSLAQSLQEFECIERGNVITVSGYPPRSGDFGTTNVLAIAQKHDSGAVEI